jgi:hypothetical protein
MGKSPSPQADPEYRDRLAFNRIALNLFTRVNRRLPAARVARGRGFIFIGWRWCGCARLPRGCARMQMGKRFGRANMRR